jgi:carbon monoxide dehydrogenase subunit G
MTVFESRINIKRPVHEVYNFLANLNNHQQIMPENIQNWVSTNDTAQFSVQNMAKLNLKVGSRIPDKEIKIIPSEKPPFDLELKWELFSVKNSTDVVFSISADLNMMLKMVASGPLQKLTDHQTQSLGSILS